MPDEPQLVWLIPRQASSGATPDNDCPMLGEFPLPLLLYIDDLAIWSHSEEGLQRIMDELEASCHTKCLTIKIEKIEP